MQPMLNMAIKAVRAASTPIINYVDRINQLTISEKGRNDFVTEVDRQAEAKIIEVIQKSYPDHNILAEESGGTLDDEAEYTWIIDPLDGTTNFIHGIPHFAISIAVRHKGKLEHAVTYDPIRQEWFTASRGQGAQLNDHRIRVSQVKKLDHALLGTGFPYSHPQHFKPYMRTFEAIFPETAGVRRGGSAALDLAYVAAGRLDGFWEFNLQQWDLAAGALLIQEAGGLVTDLQGEHNYLESGQIVAGSAKVHKSMLELIRGSLK